MTWSVPPTRKRSSGQLGTLDSPSAPELKKSCGHGLLNGSSSGPIERRLSVQSDCQPSLQMVGLLASHPVPPWIIT